MKRLMTYLKDYKKESILAPLFKLLEAFFELLVPLVMANIIDYGISNRNMGYIGKMGLLLLLLGVVGLASSITAQFFAAKAAVGFSTKLRQALFNHIEDLSFTDIDKAGTSTMITRMTSDVNQVQSGINMTLRLFLRSPIIEDSAELQLQGIPNLVRLETRNGNAEGCREIGIRELIRSSLRMRPDRIIVGEVRGAEAIDMLQCMNTGHDGSMSTGHANSAADMLSRLENMVLMGMDLPLPAIRNQIASGVDIIVHLGRIRDKSRKVLEITEVVGCENGEIRLNPLYCFEELGESSEGNVVGKLQKKGGLLHEGKLKAAGLS